MHKEDVCFMGKERKYINYFEYMDNAAKIFLICLV